MQNKENPGKRRQLAKEIRQARRLLSLSRNVDFTEQTTRWLYFLRQEGKKLKVSKV